MTNRLTEHRVHVNDSLKKEVCIRREEQRSFRPHKIRLKSILDISDIRILNSLQIGHGNLISYPSQFIIHYHLILPFTFNLILTCLKSKLFLVLLTHSSATYDAYFLQQMSASLTFTKLRRNRLKSSGFWRRTVMQVLSEASEERIIPIFRTEEFNTEDGGDMYVWNFGNNVQDYTVSLFRRPQSTNCE